MQKKNLKIILIGIAVIIASLCIAYFLDMNEWNKIKKAETEITQNEAAITAKKSYYAVIDSKIEALNNAGWVNKKKSIEVNFTSSPFFVPKVNTFFKTVVSGAGMSMTGITSSNPASVGVAAQTTTESSTKSSNASENKATTSTTSQEGYYGQLKGPVKKTTVNLSVSGTYSAFTNLLTQFENQTRIITIKSVAVTPGGSRGVAKTATSNLLNFNVVLNIYSY
jgi:hypothetical protein